MNNASKVLDFSVCVNGKPTKQVQHNGDTFIEGRWGTDYSLRIKYPSNSFNHGKRLLVIPSVDGLSVIDGKPAGKSSGGFVISRGEEMDIEGWLVNQSTMAKFSFCPKDRHDASRRYGSTKYQDSYVKSLADQGIDVDVSNTGIIGFMIIEEYIDTIPVFTQSDIVFTDSTFGNTSSAVTSSTVPLSQTTASTTNTRRLTSSQIGSGTGFGESVNVNTKTLDFNRGDVVGTHVIYYDTLKGLKRRGVPIEGFNTVHMPSAFPADDNNYCKPPKGWG